MKIKEGYVLREVAKQVVVVPIGKEALNFNGLITLNKTGKFLWEKLQVGATREELILALTSFYEVEDEIATVDVDNFLKTLETHHLLIHE